MFLQLGEAQAHRSVLEASRLAKMSRKDRLLATTASSILECEKIENVKHKIDPELVTESKDEIKVWGYMMTQYNLKAGLKQKLGRRVN
jgi:hypothetical protein